MAGPTSRLLSSIPLVGNLLNADFPGAANPGMPLVFPPTFHGEVRARALYLYSQKQRFSNPVLGFSTDLHTDLGFNDEGALIEVTARAQAGRYSFRAHYDEWLTTFKSGNGNLSWPNYRMGLDLDLYHTPTFRFGANCDINWDHPVLNAAPPGMTAIHVEWDRPATAGVHAAYNPFGHGGLALTCETRVRWPITENSRITEFEASGGLKGPETVTGTSALRGGWRYTTIDLRKDKAFELDIVWSGIFLEYVYTY
ncbi:MAG: hypothetical protein RDU20_12470 [Desulfomonilaceae bacterium]|nr:hypothetical protein [Desulfomonilaceae bacterium]